MCGFIGIVEKYVTIIPEKQSSKMDSYLVWPQLNPSSACVLYTYKYIYIYILYSYIYIHVLERERDRERLRDYIPFTILFLIGSPAVIIWGVFP